MAQDYDSPRNKDEDEESLQALSKGSQNSSSDIDDDENAIAEDSELPGADLSNEDSSPCRVTSSFARNASWSSTAASSPIWMRMVNRCVRSAPPDGVRRDL